MSKGNYVIPFRVLLQKFGVEGEIPKEITLTRDQLLALIRQLLASAPFDEAWYKKTYPDVNQAIADGLAKTAKGHYLVNGYFEGRLPGPIKVDEVFYTSTYPDVAEGIEFGEVDSAQEHFERHGFREGRLPYDMYS